MSFSRKLATIAGAAIAAAMATLYTFAPWQYDFYPRCPIYSATHLLCPGCGGTRALYEMLHLNFRSAIHYNALVAVLVPLACFWLAFCWYRAVRRGTAVQIGLHPALSVALAIVALLFTLARNWGMAFSI